MIHFIRLAVSPFVLLIFFFVFVLAGPKSTVAMISLLINNLADFRVKNREALHDSIMPFIIRTLRNEER